MPIPVFSAPEDDASDAELIARFVREARDALAHIVTNVLGEGVEAHPVIQARAMQPAWQDAQPAFDKLEESLGGITGDLAINHGLGGAQLRSELGNVNYWSERANAAARQIGAPTWGSCIVIRLLTSVDSLLDTLFAATGIGTAVKENQGRD